MEKKKPAKKPAKKEPDPQKYTIKTDTQNLHTWSCPPIMGRPPIYKTAKALAEKIALYFDQGCLRKVSSVVMGQEQHQERRIPTLAGLATFCGFAGRDSLFKQENRGDDFLYTIKWARAVIESFHEENLASGNACTGSIWWTKCNAGWKDTSISKEETAETLQFELVSE